MVINWRKRHERNNQCYRICTNDHRGIAKGHSAQHKRYKVQQHGHRLGGLGTVWGKPVFTVYVREHRYTKAQIDTTGEFTVSVPLDKPIPLISKVCGMQSGRDIDKETEAHLTLEDPEKISVPGIKEYPLTLECKVLYSQKQELEKLPDDIRENMYPQDVDGTYPMANRDAHTAYIGEIVAAYIIK